MNVATMQLVKSSLANQNRHYLLSSRVKLFCKECRGVKLVVDYFGNGDAKLDCSHRRPVAFRTPEDVTAYEAAVTEAKRKRECVPVSEAA
jgi:hypothetical protein